MGKNVRPQTIEFCYNKSLLIVEQSNLYCKQKGIVFEPITIDKVKNFAGLNILMGIKKNYLLTAITGILMRNYTIIMYVLS